MEPGRGRGVLREGSGGIGHVRVCRPEWRASCPLGLWMRRGTSRRAASGRPGGRPGTPSVVCVSGPSPTSEGRSPKGAPSVGAGRRTLPLPPTHYPVSLYLDSIRPETGPGTSPPPYSDRVLVRGSSHLPNLVRLPRLEVPRSSFSSSLSLSLRWDAALLSVFVYLRTFLPLSFHPSRPPVRSLPQNQVLSGHRFQTLRGGSVGGDGRECRPRKDTN